MVERRPHGPPALSVTTLMGPHHDGCCWLENGEGPTSKKILYITSSTACPYRRLSYVGTLLGSFTSASDAQQWMQPFVHPAIGLAFPTVAPSYTAHFTHGL